MIKRIGALVFALTLLFSFSVPASAAYDENYTYYDSLTGSGSQYFDTGVVGSSDIRIVIDFICDETTINFLFGAQASTADRYGLNMVANAAGQRLNLVVDSTTVTLGSYIFGALNTLDLNVPAGTVTLNGSTQSVPTSSFSTLNSIYLFGNNLNGSASQMGASTIYSCRIYSGGTLVRSYVPSSNPSGAYGFWDESNNTFGPLIGSGVAVPGEVWTPPADEPTVAETIRDLNTQIHDIESTIYEDLHAYSAQVDPSTATNFSGNFLSAMSFISDTWTSAYNQLGDMQVIVTFPLFLAIAMLFIGRMNSVIASGAMKSRKNNDKKGGGDVG